jgi:hypothetical protein
MNMKKVLVTALAGSVSDFHGGLSGGYTKFQYAGLSKHSPSHAQQKRDSKKAKNKGRG